jgi:hypothetical protein
MEDEEAAKPPPALAPNPLLPMLLVLIVPLPLLGMTPVTLLLGVELTTTAAVAVALGFNEIGRDATELLTTHSEAATAEFNILSLALLSRESEAFGAGAAGKRFGNARRPKDGENVFLRPLTASERESCMCNGHKSRRQVAN